MIYKCKDCGHLFEDGEQVSWLEDSGETLYGCPVCKGDYEYVKPCRFCFQYTTEDYCEDCCEDVTSRFEKLLEKEFTAEERDLLNILYDGKEF